MPMLILSRSRQPLKISILQLLKFQKIETGSTQSEDCRYLFQSVPAILRQWTYHKGVCCLPA